MPTAADDYDRIIKAGRAGLWKKAEQRLEMLLEQEPDDVSALTQLAELRRRDGDLAAAGALYRRTADLDPGDERARFLAALLTNTPTPAPTLNQDHATTPTPFLLIDDFLPPAEHARVLDEGFGDGHDYEPLPVRLSDATGAEAVRALPEVRRQRGRGHDPRVAGLLQPRLVELLPSMVERFGLAPFEVAAVVAEPTITPHGGFGRAHTDDVDRAVISFAYYLHRQPKEFSGGDLLLYDTATSTYGFDPRRFTKIDHRNNRLVVFPSRCFHEVTPVESSSEDRSRSRLAVAGVIQRSDRPG